MTEPLMVTLVTTALIVLSGFFVVIEFALMGARRHRLEEKAVESASARAASSSWFVRPGRSASKAGRPAAKVAPIRVLRA